MPFETRTGERWTVPVDPVVWTPTLLSQVLALNTDVKFLKDLTMHGVTSPAPESVDDGSVTPVPDGFLVAQVVNSDTSAGPNEVTLFNDANFGNTNVNSSEDCKYRNIEIVGTIVWDADPEDSMPRHGDGYKHKYITAQWFNGGDNLKSGEDVATFIQARFYSGPGEPNFNLPGGYGVKIEDISGVAGTNITFWVDSANGKLKMYWDHGSVLKPSYAFFIKFGPRWDE